MSKRPPLGKLALAGKRNRARQLLDREQRERDRRDLLSFVGKNSSLAASSCSGQDTPSRNERYAARVASAEKARPSSPPAAVVVASVDTNIRAHGITDVAEKIVFDGDGGKPKPPTSELDAVDEESDSGTEEVTEEHLDSWNPFDSDNAPEGYLFFGKLSFLCLGPASDFFSKTLSSKGRQVTSVEDKKSMGRAAMLKEVTARAAVNCDVGGSDRGMSLATNASFGFMAQNEDDAVQHHRDMRWATITKMIDTTQKMIDVKMRLADSMVGNGMGDELRMSVLKMMEKIEKWNEEMEQMMEEKRESNPIVGRVLVHAARSMGLAVPSTNRRTDDTLATVVSGLGVATVTKTGGTSKNDDKNFVTSLLTNDE